MKKRTQKRVSFLLVLGMLAALLCIPSLAADTSPNEFGIENYVALGDSIAHGLNDNNGTNEDAYGSWEIGYTSRLAKALGLTSESYEAGYGLKYYTSPSEGGFQSWAFPAMRTREILHQVDPDYNYVKDEFADFWLDNGDLPEYLDEIREDVANADLITLNVGSNDVLLAQLRNTGFDMDDPENGLTSSMIVDLVYSKLGMGDAPALPEGVDETALILEFIPRFLVNVMQGYGEFLVNMPKILSAIRDLNPDAQVVVLGIFNPLHYSLSLTDGKLPVSLGEMLDGVMLPMNLALAADCALYSCTYVDVIDAPTDSSLHPNNEGYQQIADKIESRLHARTSYRDIRTVAAESQKAIRWGAITENFTGLSEKVFSPYTAVTRAQFTQALYKMAGEPAVEETVSFWDVSKKAEYYDAVQWAVANGITVGGTKNTFGPGLACTRKEAVTLLYQYEKLQGEDNTAEAYDDVLAWASDLGLSEGISDTSMKLATLCPRHQAVLFLYRYANQ